MYDTNKEQVLQFVLSEVMWLTYYVRPSVNNVDIRMICTRMYMYCTYIHIHILAISTSLNFKRHRRNEYCNLYTLLIIHPRKLLSRFHY